MIRARFEEPAERDAGEGSVRPGKCNGGRGRSALRRRDAGCTVSGHAAVRTRALFEAPSGRTAVLYNSVEPFSDARAQWCAPAVMFAGLLTPGLIWM